MQDIMLWNAVLTLAVGARFDKLEEKLDRWMEKQ